MTLQLNVQKTKMQVTNILHPFLHFLGPRPGRPVVPGGVPLRPGKPSTCQAVCF